MADPTASLELTPEPPAARRYARALSVAKDRPRAGMHGFHRWYGKLIPAIPAAAVETFSEPGDLVLDPFCGSGTVLLEATLAGRRAEGVDPNPLATLLARVKTRPLDPKRLERAAARVRSRFEGDSGDGWRDELPAVPNREHFHPDPVARDLVRLLRASRGERAVELREWFEALVSAINRDVSNADTRHVFPGVSKRMRARIADGWRGDVRKRWARALADRLRWNEELHARAGARSDVRVSCDVAAALGGPPDRARLIVTNPPYVSSIRWVETFKLEAWWLGLFGERADVTELDARMLGTERRTTGAPLSEEEIHACPATCGRDAVAELTWRGEHRMARVVLQFLAGLAPSLAAAARALAPGGHAVVKIAPSRVRGVEVPTPAACTELLEREGLELLADLHDAYAPGSRTLGTARNWYSGRMDADRLLVLVKRGVTA